MCLLIMKLNIWSVTTTKVYCCGQVRLPFIGDLYDPEEGYFPTYTKGMFGCGNGKLILSAGLGSSRVNNLPELVVCAVEE